MHSWICIIIYVYVQLGYYLVSPKTWAKLKLPLYHTFSMGWSFPEVAFVGGWSWTTAKSWSLPPREKKNKTTIRKVPFERIVTYLSTHLSAGQNQLPPRKMETWFKVPKIHPPKIHPPCPASVVDGGKQDLAVQTVGQRLRLTSSFPIFEDANGVGVRAGPQIFAERRKPTICRRFAEKNKTAKWFAVKFEEFHDLEL